MTTIPFPTTPFTLSQAEALGIGRRCVERAANEGALRRLTRGVYAPAQVPDSLDLRIAAMALVLSPHHVVCDRAAAWLHGVDTRTLAEHDVPPPVETCAVRGRNPSHAPGCSAGSRDLAPEDITELGSLRVTTPLRTALDLGCNLRPREALAAMCELARRYGFTPDDLRRELRRFRGRRGVRQLRMLIPLVDPRIESPREAWTYLEIALAGLPLPEPQYWIIVDGEPTYRLDFAYPHARVYVEYDGYDAHEATPEQRAHDEERRAWLRQNGWSSVVVRRGDFTANAVLVWTRKIREALAPSYSPRRW